MPAKSKKQFFAMQAAAHGKSTLGIPKSVGQEFADATPNPGQLPAQASTAPQIPFNISKLVKKKKKSG